MKASPTEEEPRSDLEKNPPKTKVRTQKTPLVNTKKVSNSTFLRRSSSSPPQPPLAPPANSAPQPPPSPTSKPPSSTSTTAPRPPPPSTPSKDPPNSETRRSELPLTIMILLRTVKTGLKLPLKRVKEPEAFKAQGKFTIKKGRRRTRRRPVGSYRIRCR